MLQRRCTLSCHSFADKVVPLLSRWDEQEPDPRLARALVSSPDSRALSSSLTKEVHFALDPVLVALRGSRCHRFHVPPQVEGFLETKEGVHKVGAGKRGGLMRWHGSIHGVANGETATLEALEEELSKLSIDFKTRDPKQAWEQGLTYGNFEGGKGCPTRLDNTLHVLPLVLEAEGKPDVGRL